MCPGKEQGGPPPPTYPLSVVLAKDCSGGQGSGGQGSGGQGWKLLANGCVSQ